MIDDAVGIWDCSILLAAHVNCATLVDRLVLTQWHKVIGNDGDCVLLGRSCVIRSGPINDTLDERVVIEVDLILLLRHAYLLRLCCRPSNSTLVITLRVEDVSDILRAGDVGRRLNHRDAFFFISSDGALAGGAIVFHGEG